MLSDYLDDWLERRRSHLRPTTVAGYRHSVRCYLRPHLGDLRLDELDRRAIETVYARLLTDGGADGGPLSPATVRQCHAILHRALEDALLDGILARNPARSARPPRLDPNTDEISDGFRAWTIEEGTRFLNHVDHDPDRTLWHLATGTGARRGELLGLRWRDVDLDASQVRIRRALSVVHGVPRLLGTKTSQARVISIGDSVVDALERRRDEQDHERRRAASWHDRWGLVLTAPDGEPRSPGAVTARFRRLVRTLPVPAIRFHDIRHSHATWLLALGVPMKVVSDRLGHATIAMTMDTYSHVLPAMDQDAAARLEALLQDASMLVSRWSYP